MAENRRGKKSNPPTIQLNAQWCKGCYLCLEICPANVFEKSPDVSEKGFFPVLVAHPERCTHCLQCEMICPDLALDVRE